MAAKAKILWLGRDLTLLQTRCAVLTSIGHEAQPATVPEGLKRIDGYDLVVVDWLLAEEHGHLMPQVPTLVLDAFVFPVELIHSVEAKLAQSRGSVQDPAQAFGAWGQG